MFLSILSFLQEPTMDETMGQLLGWMQAFFVQIGIWNMLTAAMTITIVIGVAGAVISFARGGRGA